jgi:hypothetical protein
MSKVVASSGNTRNVNSTCNILHVPRAAQFNTSDVLKQIMQAQGMLAAGTTLPADLNSAFGGKGGVSWLDTDGSSDVTQCSWSKDIDGVVGTLSIQLKPRSPRKQYLEEVLPGDLLFVFMDDTGNFNMNNRLSGTLITVAIVDRAGQTTRVQNMTTSDTVSIAARDMAVVLSESSTVFDQAFAELENSMYTGDFIGRVFGDKKQNALSPMENVLILLLLLYDASQTGSKLNELQWKLSPTGTESDEDLAKLSQLISLLDVTTYVQNPLPFYSLAEPPGIVQAGNVWSLLESYANTLVNEFFIDVRDGSPQERNFRAHQSDNAKNLYFAGNDDDVQSQNLTIQTVLNSNLFRPDVTQTDAGTTVPGIKDGTSVVALVLRQRPYDDDAFQSLPYTEVDSTEIESLDVARSSHDVFNWFRIRFPNIDVKLQELVAGIRIVPQSIAKFGFRRMEAETRYMFASSLASITFKSGNTKTDFSDIFGKYIGLLTQWFVQNEYWYSGQMTMRFKPSIRCATRLRLNRRGRLWDFYVQGVQHNFSATPGSSRSSFTLTRGRIVTSDGTPAVSTSDFEHEGFKVNEGVQ